MAHWIRLAANPLELKVVKRASGALSIHVAQALGHLSALWDWLSKRSDDGDVSKFTDAELEDAAGWTGKKGAFASFVRDRHTDSRGRIRDWDEYMGPLVKARQAARQRQRNHRERLKSQQDADADAALGHGGNGSTNGSNGPVTRDIGGRYVTQPVTRDIPQNRRDIPKKARDRRTEVEQYKELRTTGTYLGTELCLVSSESIDEGASLNTRTNTKASQLQGIELVRAWSRRFFQGDPDAMLRSLKRMRAILRPAGLDWNGQTIRATPALLVAAMNETLASPPDKDDAADVFVVKKLSGGHLHEVRNADGALVTEALANEGKKLGREATKTLVTEAPDLLAMIGRPMPGSQKRNSSLELARLFAHAPHGNGPPS